MIDIRKLKEIVKLMVENDLSEIDLSDEQEKVQIKRGAAYVPQVSMTPMGAPAQSQSAAPASAADAAPAEDEDAGLIAITSPMVGTFYSAPDPESPAFTSIGSNVSSETVVCIVEAMKVFSEIKAECSGVVEKILVKNGDPVEYGQKLFLVRPS